MVWKIYKSNWFFKGKGGEGCGGEIKTQFLKRKLFLFITDIKIDLYLIYA